jgi:hypothetical protein
MEAQRRHPDPTFSELDPTRPFWKTRASATVTADIETSRGTITIELIRERAPKGVDRF